MSPVLVIGLVVAALVAVALVEVVRPGLVPGLGRIRPALGNALGSEPSAPCPTTRVEVVTGKETTPAVTELVQPLRGKVLADGRCLTVTVRYQEPSDTVAATRSLPLSQAPQLWIPDSTVWALQAQSTNQWPMERVGSFASSPVVLAGGKAAVAARGWAPTAPTWAQALTGKTPPVVKDLATSSPALVTLAVTWRALGGTEDATKAVAAAVLAQARAGGIGLDALHTASARSAADGPVVITSEATLAAERALDPSMDVVTVFPQGGQVPFLDYPILRVGADTSGSSALAVDAVLSRLRDTATATTLATYGLRPPQPERGATAASAAPAATASAASSVGPAVTPIPLPSDRDLGRFLTVLASVARPSRILSVVDVSLSMRNPVPNTPLTRIQLAGQAAAGAGTLLSDQSSAGLWIFALDVADGKPYQELSAIKPLAAPDSGVTHKEALIGQLTTLSGKLSGGGTALYATTLAAVKHMRATYDPRAINSVVLFTDGANENDDSVTLAQVAKELAADSAGHPGAPIALIAIGIGPGADLDALQQMTKAAGGQSGTFRANSTEQMQQVLFTALSRRPLPPTTTRTTKPSPTAGASASTSASASAGA